MRTIDRYVGWLTQRGLRETYTQAVTLTLRRFAAANDGDLIDATDADVTRWWAELQCGAAARNIYAAHISGFYRWAIRERLRDDDPTVLLVRARVRRRLPRPIDAGNLRLAIDHADEPVRTWLLCAALAGLRACEIASLDASDMLEGTLIVRDGKGGKQRTVFLHAELADALHGYASSGWLFPHPDGGHVRPNSISQRTNRYLHACGIPETLHQLRHYFGTAVYRLSNDLRLTQELMGHADPKTTAGYAAFSPEKARTVIEQLSVPA